MKDKIFIFSGLGADQRVFQKLDFSGFDVTFVNWIIPFEKETIEHYAARLLDQISGKNPILVGLSFGGIMAVEVAKQIETKKIILIASAKTKDEIPFYFQTAGKLNLQKLLPTSLLKSSNFMTNWFFDASSSEDQQLLKQILNDTNPIFLQWALDKVANWTNSYQPKNIFQIHGDRDRILPLQFIKADVVVKNGGHLMTLNKSEELTRILRNDLLIVG